MITTANDNVVLGTTSVGDWILAKFTNNRQYVGKVENVFGNYEFTVKFARRMNSKNSLNFRWPDVEDICDVEFPQIVKRLKTPVLGRRGELTFIGRELQRVEINWI
jgi:hypothetical protein